jgi:hypothetical protein
MLIAASFALAAIAPACATPGPVELKPPTTEAYERYVRLTQARNDEELRLGSPFLFLDALDTVPREAAYAALRRGEVRIEREARVAGQVIQCPDGMIHHWVGMIFVPGATLGETLRLLQDYNHQASYYSPDVMRSRILAHSGNDFRVYMRFRRKKVITVVLDTEHEIHYLLLDATRAHSRSATLRVTEVENPGKADETQKPVGRDGGYLWRMNTWWRFLERDGGTYVQSESVSLTRSIPTGFGWLIRPFVTSIPREALTFTLTATRSALTQPRPGSAPAR